jgi:spore germination protein YaaH
VSIKAKILVVFAIVAALAAAIVFGKPLYDHYSYSNERKDLREHFRITEEDEAPILLQNTLLSERARVWGGVCYWDIASVWEYLNERFYINPEERILLYTSADEVVRAEYGASAYTRHAESDPEQVDAGFVVCREEGGVLFIALDYVRLFANFSWELFVSPFRVQMYTEWGEIQTARVQRDTVLRTYAGGKSPILADLRKGDSVIVLNELDNWSRVKTGDAVIGFVENSRLSGAWTEEQAPVADYAPPPYTDQVRDFPICLVWHQVAVRDANQYLWGMLEHADPVNVVSPTWFRITDAVGTLSSIASLDYVQTAHARGLEVWALVSDFESETELDRHAMLSSSTNRASLIANLVAAAEEYDLDGLNIDFELVPTDDGAHFAQFLREFSIACRKAGLVFSVDNYVPRTHTEHYNRRVQGEVADYIVIMGYDEHWSGSGEAGSVASIGFVEDGIQRTLEEVPARKVVNGVPFYTRIWSTKDGIVKASAVGQTSQAEWVANRGLAPEWDEETGQNYAEYESAGTLWQIWLEDADSMETRVEMMKGYGLGGIAAWRLGLERPEIWDVLAGYVDADSGPGAGSDSDAGPDSDSGNNN